MSNDMSQTKIMAALDWAYDKAVDGVAGLDSASDIAESYMKNSDSPFDQANSLIRWQNAKAGTSGFITGLGGFLVMPLTIPANLASVMYVQIRMIAAIAHIGGHDLRDDRVKTLVLTGHTADKIYQAVVDCEGYQEGKPAIIREDDFKAAVHAAYGAAEEGDIVILSPACASFDHFKNFAQRGQIFKAIVNELN